MRSTEVVGRKYSVEILEATGAPKSANQLSKELDVPIATCYRRIHELVDVGFLEEHTETEAGDLRTSRFRRTVDSIEIRFDESPTVSAFPRGSRRAGLQALAGSVLSALGATPQSSHPDRPVVSESADSDVSVLESTDTHLD